MSTRAQSHGKTRLALAGITFAAASVIAVPIASAGTPAGSSSPTGSSTSTAKLAKARTRCEAMVSRRQVKLTKDLALVHAATGAPEADRTTLTTQLEDARTTLTGAASAIASADSDATLKDACKGAVEDTRVFILDGPKVMSVVATSRLAKIDARVAKADGRFEKLLARAEKRGVPAEAIADAKAKAVNAKSALADAHTKIDGLDATLLPITPAQVNDHAAEATLTDARARIKAAASDAKQIRADHASIVKDLRPSKP